ncbi:hypothetical protein SPRG_09541 [Saprolegnia parasitica CBS 223.65]|uniref:START domain-containing protein n=1 Tax=Saprolegnia parasitica (strain CBS 223.65) TaxID=695850 RepID=A0A067CDJ9_SAPPC|nr:hypothetical protein SPRG_09541 [Saprolegnia parasitica CBS 223.65]KDO24897.1 hypothetical protein SPRG_09541 [Saprolegnia parasitica CBS 223.65]|eukprot:XP_012204357.1 hypothetical protein SPRG_09541 [Saprolegnia parasitica CBS 223.65]
MARRTDATTTWATDPLDALLLDETHGRMEEITLSNVSDFLAELGDFAAPAKPSRPASAGTSPSPSSSSSPSSTMPTAPAKRMRTTPKEELEYLHSKQRYLLTQLKTLQAAVAVPANDDPWHKRAQNQAQAAQRALQENVRLKAAYEDQLKMIQALERVFQKKPKLQDATPKHQDLLPWRRYMLGVNNRERDMEAILRHQYDKLDTEFIRHNVYQLRDTLVCDGALTKREFVESTADNIVLHFVRCKRWPIDYLSFSRLLWDFVSLNVKVPVKTKVDSERLQSFQNDMLVYTRHTARPWSEHMDIPPVVGRTASMRFLEKDRVVIVWKSIADDALVPFPDHDHVKDNKAGWAVITPDGPDGCRLATYSRLTTPVFPSMQRGSMTETILSLYETNSGRFDAALTAEVDARRKAMQSS